MTEGRWTRSTVALAALLGAAHLFVGLLFLRHGGQTKDFGWTAAAPRAGERVVASVDPAGPASGRLAAGDRILAVNGDPRVGRVWGLHFFAVKPGSAYTLRVARGAALREVTLAVGHRHDPTEWWRCLPRLSLSLGWALLALGLARRRGPGSGGLGLSAGAWSLVTLSAALPAVDLLDGVEYAGAIPMINLSPVHLALTYHALTGLAGARGRLTSWVGAALYMVGGLLSLGGLVQRFTYLLASPQAVIGFASDHPGLWEARVGVMRLFGPVAAVALLAAAARLRTAGVHPPASRAVLLAGGLSAASALAVQVAAAGLGTTGSVALGLLSDGSLLLAGLAVARARAGPGDDDLQDRTIRDFGRQWQAYPEVSGYFASTALLADVCGPLLGVDEIRGRRVAEIGSGQGRIVEMLLEAGAAHVVAVEPSDAFDVLRRNLERHGSRVSLLPVTGDRLPATADLDIVFSIGVLHHIPDPAPVVRAARAALRPGGRMLIWVYGREGNRMLLFFLLPLRRLTRRLPDRVLRGIVRAIDPAVRAYIAVSRGLPVPLRRYFRDVLGRFGPRERRLTLYDQLNPAYARYYRRAEAVALLDQAGFADVRCHHRHGYSWTVIGTRP